MNRRARRRLALCFGALAALTLLGGSWAWSIASPGVLLLALTPLFAVLALATGVTARPAKRREK